MSNSQSTHKNLIPNDWKIEKLGFIAEKIGDGLHGTPEYMDTSEYFFVNGNNLREGRIVISSDTKRVSKETYEIHKKDLKFKSILISINGTIGSLAFYNGENIVLGKSAAYINFKVENSEFIYYYLQSGPALNFIEEELTGSTIRNLSLKSIREMPVLSPPLPEQKAIAAVLSLMDSAIDKTNQLIAQKELQKKALMQQLLTGKKRLKGFGGEKWKSVKMEDVSQIRRGASPRPIEDPKWFSETGRGWIRISDVTKSYIYLNETTQYLSEEGAKKSVKVDSGDLIMSICATIGVPMIVNIPACIHDGFVLFSNFEKSMNKFFLFYILQYKTEGLAGEGQPGTQKNLNTAIVGNIKLTLPSLREQIVISKVLQSADKEIQLLKAKAAKLKEQKKGLMQVLLTGKKRLKGFKP